jgi:hypothetical protein
MLTNNQIKKEAVRYTPACEWPTAILSQAYVTQPAPIINSVMHLKVADATRRLF